MFRRLVLTLFVFVAARPLGAEVVRVEIASRTDVLLGKSFGNAGVFEALSGKLYLAANPKNTANQIIADIEKAQKNASGQVEFSADFFLIKPKDVNRGNGTVLVEVPNRGNKRM